MLGVANRGIGVGPIHLSALQCSGVESSLLNCSHGNSVGCTHESDSGVICSQGN